MGSTKVPSGEYSAHEAHEPRIAVLENRVDSHSETISRHSIRLGEGDVSIAEITAEMGNIRKSVDSCTDAINGAVRWLLATVGAFAAGGVLYSIVQAHNAGALK